MKTIAIITIYGENNYGNRLQNYALQTFLEKLNCQVISIKNEPFFNNSFKLGISKIKRSIKIRFSKIIFLKKAPQYLRLKKFQEFNKKINITKKYYSIFNKKILNKYDYYICGSDQIWNPELDRLSNLELLKNVNNSKRIAYAASFGIDKLSKKDSIRIKDELIKFKKISVREQSGKEIIKELTNRNDIEVLIDPTMLLSVSEWNKVLTTPKNIPNKKYILNYFLSDISEKEKKSIEALAQINNCEIINLLDKNDPFYTCGPSEFLYLEKNAFLICTDSYHSCVFAILYNVPFVVFERSDKFNNMNSRIETLLCTFKLQNQKYINEITDKMINYSYDESNQILKAEIKKSEQFIKESLDIID